MTLTDNSTTASVTQYGSGGPMAYCTDPSLPISLPAGKSHVTSVTVTGGPYDCPADLVHPDKIQPATDYVIRIKAGHPWTGATDTTYADDCMGVGNGDVIAGPFTVTNTGTFDAMGTITAGVAVAAGPYNVCFQRIVGVTESAPELNYTTI